MEIKKEIIVNLTPEDVQQIIRQHLKTTQNLEVTSIRYVIVGHNDPDDWRGALPLDYLLDEVVCTGIEA